LTARQTLRRRLVPTLAAAAVMALTVALGNWQLRRADEKAALQQARDAALALAPVTLDGAPLQPAELDGRRVSVQGVFDPAHTIFLDNRTRNGVAGFHVLAPLRIARPAADGAPPPHVLVLRGWIARDPVARARLPPLRTPEGPVRIEGLAGRFSLRGGGLMEGHLTGQLVEPEPGSFELSLRRQGSGAASGAALEATLEAALTGEALPSGLFDALLRLYALFSDKPPFTSSQLKALTAGDDFSGVDIEQTFGFKPTPFSEGIRETFCHPVYSKYVVERTD
jgi:hypothetical protein